MSEPITKVYDADGNLVHDCDDAGCDVSWDGYALREHALEAPPSSSGSAAIAGETAITDDGAPLEATGETAAPSSAPIAEGDELPGRADPGPEWDTSTPGVARLKAQT